jgi:hypothetical protein
MKIKRHGCQGNMGFVLHIGKARIRLTRHQFAMWHGESDKAKFNFSF